VTSPAVLPTGRYPWSAWQHLAWYWLGVVDALGAGVEPVELLVFDGVDAVTVVAGVFGTVVTACVDPPALWLTPMMQMTAITPSTSMPTICTISASVRPLVAVSCLLPVGGCWWRH